MTQLLVVDDEPFAVKAILKGIDWAGAGIERVHAAYDAEEAMDVLREHPVDIVLSDIEMPGMNGLELQEWINANKPNAVTVFFTGHANFSFAQQALRLGGFDYLLKPVKHEQLLEVVRRARAKLRQERELILWDSQKAIIAERFWQDVLAMRTVPSEANLRRALGEEAPGPSSSMAAVLVSVEYWHKEFTFKEEELMEYAVRNAAEELLLQGRPGRALQDASGASVVLSFVADEEAADFQAETEKRCAAFAAACAEWLYCTVSCFVGRPVPIADIADAYRGLLEAERRHVSGEGIVRSEKEGEPVRQSARQFVVPLDWDSWMTLLEAGKTESLRQRLDGLLEELRSREGDAEAIEAVYHSLLHVVYHVAHKNGVSVRSWTGGRRTGEEPPRTIAQLKAWAERALLPGLRHLELDDGTNGHLIDQIKTYIQSRLKDVTREEIAANVYLNATYLSRLFKKETGQSLVHYIIDAKIRRAKVMLTESRSSVLEIGDSLGYENFSHFSKTFKKIAGLSPLEYRKRYQTLMSDKS
ncbi:response regulator [Cohnella sp. GCM10027633]|uniref:response regulator transcription factor n=1 Tax=unclassified Cohnella TaxID=2636738 RepID=UPI00362FFFF3